MRWKACWEKKQRKQLAQLNNAFGVYPIKGATLTVALFLCPLAWMDEEERECLFVPDEAVCVEPQQARFKPKKWGCCCFLLPFCYPEEKND